jgi:hypothetical protein
MVAWDDNFVFEIEFLEKSKELLEVLVFDLVSEIPWIKIKFTCMNEDIAFEG